MRQITKTFHAVQSGDHWAVFGRTEHGYSFSIQGDCDGFMSFRDARYFTLRWLAASAKAGVYPSSVLGRQIAHTLKLSYNDWLEASTKVRQTA